METIKTAVEGVMQDLQVPSPENTETHRCPGPDGRRGWCDAALDISINEVRCKKCFKEQINYEKWEEEKHRREEEEKRRVSIIHLGGLRAYETYNFENFKENEKNKYAISLCREYDPKKDNLLLYGPAGSGKSHLAVATARQFNGIVYKPMEISRELRAARDADKELEIINRFVRYPMLVIDDLGVEKATEFLTVLLFEIIDGRYQAMKGGLIITSNVGLDGLSARLSDDRISSRLSEMCVKVSLNGSKDYRLDRR